MAEKNKKIALLSASLATAIIFIFLIFNYTALSEKKENKEEKMPASNLEIEKIKTSYSLPQNQQNQFKQTFIDPFIKQSSFSFLSDNPLSDKSQESLPVQEKKAMNDEEYFKIAYPDYYIGYLNAMAKMMEDNGYPINADEKQFASEEKIIAFLNKYIDYLAAQGAITEGQKIGFKFGVNNTLPELNEKEKQAKSISQIYIKKSIEKLAWVAFGEKACAIVSCFWIGAPKPIGANLWAPCCNCGWNCGKHGCWFVPDCGVGGCQINTGCINGVCGYANSSIWDPMGGICGCG